MKTGKGILRKRFRYVLLEGNVEDIRKHLGEFFLKFYEVEMEEKNGRVLAKLLREGLEDFLAMVYPVAKVLKISGNLRRIEEG